MNRPFFALATAGAVVLSCACLPAGVQEATGQWIWLQADGPANTWMCFRREFTLEAAPAKAMASIAVDSKYWLWINGKAVVFEGGLKRGPTPHDTYCDEVDLAPHLAKGKNTVAVLVWYWGKDGFSHKSSGKGGLWLSVDLGEVKLATDKNWKAKVHPAYGVTGKPHPNYRLSEANVAFDARQDMPGWQEAGFDDSAWPAAVEKGTPPCAPWNKLAMRPIPLWKDYGRTPYVNAAALPAVSDGKAVDCQLPYDAQVTPYLKIDAPAGLKIEMRTDHYSPGDTSVRAEYVTKQGVQEYESLGWMNGHVVHYTIPAGVKILSLQFRETGYDCAFSGSFACEDALLNKLWKRSVRTLYVTMRDNYMDCPDRERGQWWGDAVNELGEVFYCLDTRAHALTRKAIENLSLWQRQDKTLFSPVPGNYNVELPPQMLASVGWYGFWTYYLYTGDAETIRLAYPHVRDYLAIWQLNGNGLVVHRKGGWDWTDWGQDIDSAVTDSAWYYLALKGAVEMARLTGNDADIPGYQAKLKSIADNFDRAFWTGSAYRSGAYKGKTDDRANALAVVAGLAGPARFDAIRKVLAAEYHASPYMEKYVLEALYRMNDPQAAMERMKKRYRPLLDLPISTLPEHWNPRAGSLNHGWSGGPLTLLSQYGAGIAPDTPGFAHYHVLPQMGGLKTIRASLTTVRGQITADIQRGEKRFTLKLDSPEGTEATAGVPRETGPFRAITVNGKAVNIASIKQNQRYYLITVPAGSWTIVAE